MGRHKKYFTEEERKTAQREYHKQYYQNNKEKIAERMAVYYQSNKEKFAEYRQNNKEKFAEYNAEWRKNNKEKYAEYQAKYYQNNKEKFSEYYQNNKEKFAEYNAEYYQKNKEKILEQITEKRTTPIGKAQMHVDNYIRIDRIYKRGECTLTPEWIVEHILTQPCHYCGKTDWHELGCDRIDNSLPHRPDNVVPCCTDCNKKRGTTPYDEFMKKIGKIA